MSLLIRRASLRTVFSAPLPPLACDAGQARQREASGTPTAYSHRSRRRPHAHQRPPLRLLDRSASDRACPPGCAPRPLPARRRHPSSRPGRDRDGRAHRRDLLALGVLVRIRARLQLDPFARHVVGDWSRPSSDTRLAATSPRASDSRGTSARRGTSSLTIMEGDPGMSSADLLAKPRLSWLPAVPGRVCKIDAIWRFRRVAGSTSSGLKFAPFVIGAGVSQPASQYRTSLRRIRRRRPIWSEGSSPLARIR